MIYEWKEWIICFFMNKAHFFRKMFCKRYISGGSCEKRYVFGIGFFDCCYEKCPRRKGGK
jgi:hypothetical protein